MQQSGMRVCVCVHVRLHTRVRVRVHAGMCLRKCVHVHACMNVHVCAHVCVHVCACACVCACVHARMCACVTMYVPGYVQPPLWVAARHSTCHAAQHQRRGVRVNLERTRLMARAAPPAPPHLQPRMISISRKHLRADGCSWCSTQKGRPHLGPRQRSRAHCVARHV